MSLNFLTFSRRFALKLWPWYVIGLVFLALTNMITVKIPEFAAKVTDGLGQEPQSSLSSWALIIVGLGFAQFVCRSLSRVFIFWPGRSIEAASKTSLFAHTIRLPKSFLDSLGVGDIISRLSNDLGQLRVFFAFGMLQIFNLFFLTIFTVSQMWHKNPKLTLICLSPVILMVFISRVLMPKLSWYSRLQQEALGELTNKVTESFVSIHLVKTNAAEKSFAERAAKKVELVYQSNIKLIFIRTVLFPLVGTLATISQVIVLFFGGHEVMAGRLSVGDILAFNVYLVTLAFPITSLGIIISIYLRSKTALQRLDTLASTDEECAIQKTEHAAPATPFLQVRNLTFEYPLQGGNKRQLALKNISFSVEKGEKIGICGPVGSGKSTILKLLTRLYDPPEASIFLDGVDLLAIDQEVIRKRIGYSLQEAHLFSDSIRGNVIFGVSDDFVQEHDLDEALEKASILHDIARLPRGLDTQIGERGVRLSGGQKQRLALARMFFRNYEVWLLDDSLSAVDANTETKIIKHLFESDRTMIISSHRRGPLEMCDRIFYFEQGSIVEQASYRELIKAHPELRDTEGALK
jgi:ATP-binding cassette subfamily B protein